jgi:pimeloyl-ACP methyl ester carboxylesterase
VGKLTPFKDLAEGLAQRGIASIRYDKRSFAHPFKLLKERDLTVRQETIEDAILAADLLKQHPSIDPEKVFIAGHSMGGMLAPRIDAEGGNFRGLILLAGSPRKLEDILLYQTRETLSLSGKLVRFILEKQIKTLEATFQGLYNLTDEEAKAKKIGGGTTAYYFKEMGEHSVEGYLAQLTKPILVMQGSKDFQVKADVDFVMYQELLADHPNASFRHYDNLNHCFVPSVFGRIDKAKQEYAVECFGGLNGLGHNAVDFNSTLIAYECHTAVDEEFLPQGGNTGNHCAEGENHTLVTLCFTVFLIAFPFHIICGVGK